MLNVDVVKIKAVGKFNATAVADRSFAEPLQKRATSCTPLQGFLSRFHFHKKKKIGALAPKKSR